MLNFTFFQESFPALDVEVAEPAPIAVIPYKDAQKNEPASSATTMTEVITTGILTTQELKTTTQATSTTVTEEEEVS